MQGNIDVLKLQLELKHELDQASRADAENIWQIQPQLRVITEIKRAPTSVWS
jgi:hypothetical protein